MATRAKPDDARQKRADARQERRRSSPEKDTGDRSEAKGSPTPGGSSTLAFVGIGAAVGGAAAAAKALRDRQRRQPEAPREPDEHEDDRDRGEDSEEQESRPRAAVSKLQQQPSQLRDLVATVLEAALDAVREQNQPRSDDDGDGRERRSERRRRREQEADEEEDDDEDDARPRGATGGENVQDDEAGDEAPRGDDRRNGSERAPVPVELVQGAKAQLARLVGSEPEAVTSVERTDDGWRLQLQVVEVERIPSSTDVLAAYEVHLDDDGSLVDYARTRRYHRSQPEAELHT